MLQDGDRVLVCLSGSSASLCLLHALRQFVRARQLHVELAAVALMAVATPAATVITGRFECVEVGGRLSIGGIDPRAMMVYLRDLGVRFYCEPLGKFRDEFTLDSHRWAFTLEQLL